MENIEKKGILSGMCCLNTGPEFGEETVKEKQEAIAWLAFRVYKEGLLGKVYDGGP